MRKILIIIVVIIALVVVWYLVRPLLVNDVVNEDFPTLEEIDEMSDEEKALIQETQMDRAASLPPVIIEEEKPSTSGPELLLSGELEGADSFHRGSGETGVYELEDGTSVLRFENFSVTNGPDLRVLLSESSNPDDIGEYIELGKLKGNQGNQNYDIPSGIDISKYKSVFIYCKPFHVIFAVAIF